MKSIFTFPSPSKESGQSLVEMGLTLMIVLVLLAGAVDFGVAFFHWVALRDAAQEGAVYGSVCPTNSGNQISDRIKASSNRPIDFQNDPNLITPFTIDTGSGCEGGVVTVTITYNYHLSMPLIGSIIGRQTIPLSATVKDTILSPECGKSLSPSCDP